jgi:hypothetical protein
LSSESKDISTFEFARLHLGRISRTKSSVETVFFDEVAATEALGSPALDEDSALTSRDSPVFAEDAAVAASGSPVFAGLGSLYRIHDVST